MYGVIKISWNLLMRYFFFFKDIFEKLVLKISFKHPTYKIVPSFHIRLKTLK